MAATMKDLEAAFDKNKALFFLDVTLPSAPKELKKYVAYIPQYNTKLEELRKASSTTTTVLPYREKYSHGQRDSMKTFKDNENQTVREMPNFGTHPVKNPIVATNTSNPFPKLSNGVLLHFYIVRDANKYSTGVQVGIAQVTAPVLSETKQTITGRLTIPIYRVGEKVKAIYQRRVDESNVEVTTNAVFVATWGGAPEREPEEPPNAY